MLSNVRDFVFHQYEVILLPRVRRYWPRVVPYYDLVKSALFRGIAAFVVVSFCLYISSFLFGVVYYYNIPTIYHTYELNFQYNRRCIQAHRNFLKNGGTFHHVAYEDGCYPTAVIDFDSLGSTKILRAEQLYSVYLSLELPESNTNLEIGMFMAKMTVGKKKMSRPASLRFRQPLLRYGYIALFWPLFLYDFLETKQTLDIPLFEKIRFEHPTSENVKICQRNYGAITDSWGNETPCNNRRAKVEIDYPDIQIYSARLHLTATFSGLQHFLFRWPVFSFLVGTAIFFVPVLSSVLVAIYLIFCKPLWMNISANDGIDEGREDIQEGRQNEANNALLQAVTPPDASSNHGEDNRTDSSVPSTPSLSIEMIGSPLESSSEATNPPDSNPLPNGDNDKSDDEAGSSLRRRK